MDLRTRLSELAITLPTAAAPQASYIPAQRSGELIYVSGQLPVRDGELIATGQVGSRVGLAAAQDAARQCAINALAAADQLLEGDWSGFQRVVRVGVFVASGPTFFKHHIVGNGASELLQDVFGPAGRHARAAVGVPVLPLNASVEVELLLEVREYMDA